MKRSAAIADETPAQKAGVEPIRDFSRSLPMVLLRAREAVMARFRPMLREHDVTEQQWRVLRALASTTSPLRSGELSQLTLLSAPSLSRLLKTLEARRLIGRTVHSEDSRAAQLTITRSGRALVAAIAPESESHYHAIGEAIGERDMERLYQLLDRAIARLGEPDVVDE